MRVIEPMLLLLIAQEPSHGYELVERLAEGFGVGTLQPQTVYRILQAMEEHQWVKASWDVDSGQGPPRKVYRITPEGEDALDAWIEEMVSLRDMLDAFLDRYRGFRESYP